MFIETGSKFMNKKVEFMQEAKAMVEKYALPRT